MSDPYRHHGGESQRRTLSLPFRWRVRQFLGLLSRFHVMELRGSAKISVAATDDPAIALKTVRYLLRERKGVTVDDVLLWHFNPPIEFVLTEQHIDDILSNQCSVCGTRFHDPCDAGLHS